MKKQKPLKTKEEPLDEEAIERIKKHLKSEELGLNNTVAARDYLKRQVELELPMKNALAQLEQIELEVKRIQSNVDALNKQIEEKKITIVSR